MLVHLREEFGSSGPVLIGPTCRYGYFDDGRREPALRRQETQHIQGVLDQYYSSLPGLPIPISERNFDVYGVSTTPTLVLIDRAGIVSLYHPGKMSYTDLARRSENSSPDMTLKGHAALHRREAGDLDSVRS